MNYRIFIERRPILGRQPLPISLLNYGLAVLLGCSIGSLFMAMLEHVKQGYWANIFGLGFRLAFYLAKSLPYAFVGFLPVALFGEVLGRSTRMHPIGIAALAGVVSVSIALWLGPGVGLPYRTLACAVFGVTVSASWALLSFGTDRLAAVVGSADRA